MIAAVGNWFRKRLALVTVCSERFALGGVMFRFEQLYHVYGWWEVILGIAIGIWVIGVPLSLLVRHKPSSTDIC
jgi:hypothetical protein